MASGVTIEDVLRLAHQLSALDKLKIIERLAPELEPALGSIQGAAVSESEALDDQYQRGYERFPEDTTELKALLPHLPLPRERWE